MTDKAIKLALWLIEKYIKIGEYFGIFEAHSNQSPNTHE